MEGEVFDCSKCNKVFKNSLGLAMHKATYHEQKNYICEICSQPYKYRRGLSIHYTRNHANNHNRFIGHQSGHEIEVNDAINDINNIEKAQPGPHMKRQKRLSEIFRFCDDIREKRVSA